MAKGKAKKDGPDSHNDDQQKVQAILLADSFNTNFRPISYEMPKVLCPLVNRPMIDYTLELLASNGVEEVFVFCVNHAEQLSEYLKQSRWGEHMQINCITSTNCLSAGDALREIDRAGFVHGDPFVLIHGDVVSNIDLRSVLQAHKEAKKKDPSKIMTMCFTQASPTSKLRPLMNDLVVGLDRDTRQIVLFNNNVNAKAVSLPTQAFEDHAQIEFRSDLLDCFIDVCSPEVLVQISDNFDYQDLRQHFVSNEVANVELGNKITAHIAGPREYGARVEDLRLYDHVSRDVIRRWTYPMVPDNGTTGGCARDSYLAARGAVYRARGLTLPRSVAVGAGSVIAAGVTVGEGTRLCGSVIGRGCRVGARATVLDSYVWEGATVEDGACVTGAVLSRGSVVRAGAVVPTGCVLGPNVIVGAGVQLPPFTRLTCMEKSEGDWGGLGSGWGVTPAAGDAPNGSRSSRESSLNSSSSSSVVQSGTATAGVATADAAAAVTETDVVGPDGQGRVWQDDENDDDVEDDVSIGSDDVSAAVDTIKCRSIGCVDEQAWRDKRWGTMEDEEADFAAVGSDDEAELGGTSAAAVSQAGHNFHALVKDVLITGHKEKHPVDNLLLEIKGLKFAQNRNFAECIQAATEAVLDLSGCASNDSGALEGMELVGAVRDQLLAWKSLLTRLAMNPSDQVEVVTAVEKHALRAPSTPLAGVFRFVLQLLYDQEIVSEEAMAEWIAARRQGAKNAPEMALFNAEATQAFVEWIEDEESGDDDSEGGSSEAESD